MEQYNFRLKEYRKIALKFYLAPWRVLGIDKWRRFAPPDKHTPPQNHQAERKARAKRSRPLNRLGELPLFRSLVFFRIRCLIIFCLS